MNRDNTLRNTDRNSDRNITGNSGNNGGSNVGTIDGPRTDSLPQLQRLSALKPMEKMQACPTCGQFAWFDPNLVLLDTVDVGDSPRFKNFAGAIGVYVCANDLTPIVSVGGEFLDAREYITSEQIEALLEKFGWTQHLGVQENIQNSNRTTVGV